MSLLGIQADLDSIIKPLLKEIKTLLEKLNEEANSTTEIVEAAAAKIISEMKNCPCNEEIIKTLGAIPKIETDDQIIPSKDKQASSSTPPYLYSYPNSSVGNVELGTGENPKSLTWPFGSEKK